MSKTVFTPLPPPSASKPLPLDSLPGPAVVFDPLRRVAAWNDGFHLMLSTLGLAPSCGEEADVLLGRLGRSAGVELSPFWEGASPIEEELIQSRTLLRTCSLLKDGGRLVQWIDIAALTRRRRSQRAKGLQRILERASVAIGAVGVADNCWVFCNRALAAQSGGPVVGRHLHDLMDHCPGLIGAVEAHARHEAVFGRRIRWGDTWFSVHVQQGEIDGEWVHLVWLDDISAAVAAEAHAESAARTLAELLDAATDPVLDLDLQRGVARCNRRLLDLLGSRLSAGPLVREGDGWYRMPAQAVLQACGEDAGVALFELAAGANGEGGDQEVWQGMLDVQGSMAPEFGRHVSVRVRRFGPDGRTLLLISDIDAVHRQAEALKVLLVQSQQAASAKERFLATMSHELRTPFAGIATALRLLLDAIGGGEARIPAALTELLGQAHVAGQGMTALLDDLLDLQRIEAGRFRYLPQPIQPTVVAGQVVDLLAGRKAEHVDLGLTVSNLPDWIEGDGDRLRQVLFNLVGNAIKFTTTGAVKVDLDTRPGETEWYLRVSDTGPGIPPAILDRLRAGERFVMEEEGRPARAHGGSGLGLSIVRSLAEAMGGRMEIDSVVGRGTVVSVELPLRPASPAGSVHSHVLTAGRLSAISVLLVEDDALLRSGISTMLSRLGVRLTQASSGNEALDLISRSSAFDVVLTDLHMPVVSGWDIARALQAMPIQPRVIALTADAVAAGTGSQQLKQVGIEQVLLKPATPEILAAALQGDPVRRYSEVAAGSEIWSLDVTTNACGGNRRDGIAMARRLGPHLAPLIARIELMPSGVELRSLAHTVKGIASMVGAHSLKSAAAELEGLAAEAGADVGDVKQRISRRASELLAAVEQDLLKESVHAG